MNARLTDTREANPRSLAPGAAAGLSIATFLLAACASAPATKHAVFAGAASPFAPGVISSPNYSDVRLTISPDGRTALWFSRNRPGGAGGYDIWVSRREGDNWSAPTPASFNSAKRDFDPAFSADGRAVYFSSDRPGSLGGDDVYRVPFDGNGFGDVEHLGHTVNSAGNEWAPMLSPDGRRLLFSSDGRGGAGRMDLYSADLAGNDFAVARALPGDINSADDEFDATFLDDGATVVFTRAPDLRKDDVHLLQARRTHAGYDRGMLLPPAVNMPGGNAYAPMLDWSRPHRLTFTDGRDALVIEYEWK